VVLLYLLQRLQPLLPLGFGRGVDGDTVPPAMAFNTAVSFVTNTNWQSYVPETVLGHTVQMAGLTVQDFVSAAVGMAVGVALTRGFIRSESDRLGNWLGNWLGPAGGLPAPGHPGLPDPHLRRDGAGHPPGHVLVAVMGAIWGGLLAVAWWAELNPNGPAALAAGAALEGKETRFGIPSSVLFAVSTTGTSTGAVNSLHDSYTGLGGGGTLLNMLLGRGPGLRPGDPLPAGVPGAAAPQAGARRTPGT
jgi:K+-transporting ATPase A subunit